MTADEERRLHLAAKLLSHMLELDSRDQLDVIAYALQGWFYKQGRGRVPPRTTDHKAGQ